MCRYTNFQQRNLMHLPIHLNYVLIWFCRLRDFCDENSLSCGWCLTNFKRCFNCLMRVNLACIYLVASIGTIVVPCFLSQIPDVNLRRNDWQHLVHNPKFIKAENNIWQDIQVNILKEVQVNNNKMHWVKSCFADSHAGRN